MNTSIDDEDIRRKAIQLYRAYGQPPGDTEEPLLLSALKFYARDLEEMIDLRTTGHDPSDEVLAYAALYKRVEELIHEIETPLRR